MKIVSLSEVKVQSFNNKRYLRKLLKKWSFIFNIFVLNKEALNDNLVEQKHAIDASSQNTLLKKKLQDLNSRYTNLRNNHESEILRLENSIQSLHRTHNEQLGVLNSTIKSLQNKLEKVRNENTELMNSLCSTANSSKVFSPISSPQNSISDLLEPSNDIYLKLKTTEIENKRLLEDLDNQIEINNILQDQIKSTLDYKNLFKKSQSEVKKLQKKISQLNKGLKVENFENKCDNLNLNSSDQKYLINRIKELEKSCAKKDKEITVLSKNIGDLTIELSEVKSELSKSQLCQVKSNVPNKDENYNQIDNSNFSSFQATDKGIEFYDDMIKKQNQQIAEITEQRDSLMKKLKEVESNAASINEKLEIKNEQLNTRLNQITEETEAQFDDLLNKFSNNYDIIFDSSKTPYQNIVDLIESGILSQNTQNQSQFPNNNFKENQPNLNMRNLKIYSEGDMEKEREKKAILLKQLENAINFIHSLANSSNSTGTPQFDFRDRTLILTQCARMGQIIEDEDGDNHKKTKLLFNELEHSSASLFDPMLVEENAKTFFYFLDQREESINESPIHELYVMFLATLEVNFLLYNKINEMQSISKNSQQFQEQQKRSQQQNSLKHLLEDQNSKIKEAKMLIQPYVQKTQSESLNENEDCNTLDDFLFMLQVFVESHEELIQEHEKNLSEGRQNKSDSSYETNSYVYSAIESTSTSQNERRLKGKNVSFRSNIIPNMDSNTIKTHLQKAKTKNTKLQENIQQLIKEKNEIEEISRKKIAEAKNSLKKSKKENKNLLDQNQKLKNQCAENDEEMDVLKNKLKELSGSNQRLMKEKNELEVTMEKKYVEIRENDKKIKDKNNSLTKRVSELEQMNNQALSELKERTIEMVDKYDDRVEKLDQELKDTRERLIDALSEIKTLKNDKITAQATIKKMKFEEKNNKCFIDQLTTQIKNREKQITEKYKYDVFQNKAQYTKKIMELKDALKTARQQLADLLYKKFKVRVPIEEENDILGSLNEYNFDDIGINTEKDAFDKIILIFGQLINENAVAELAQLDLGKHTSITDLFQDMKNEIHTNQLIIQQMEIKNSDYEEEVKRLTNQSKKLEDVQKDRNSWVLWARSLYRQITEGLAAPGSTGDLRCALEESLMASIGHRKMQRKLEILRAEKKAFTIDPIKKVLQKMNENNRLNIISNFNVSKPGNSNIGGVQKVYSVRPVVLMLMCARRLQVYSGCLTSAYKCGNDESNNLSLFTESS